MSTLTTTELEYIGYWFSPQPPSKSDLIKKFRKVWAEIKKQKPIYNQKLHEAKNSNRGGYTANPKHGRV